MKRILTALIALLGLLGWALGAPGPAQAQVATPQISTGGVRILNSGYPTWSQTGIVPENPAAQQFGAPSRVVLGTASASSYDSIDGNSTAGAVGYWGLRVVIERVSLGYETTTLAVTDAGGLTQEINDSTTFAFTFPADLAFGVSWDRHQKQVGANGYDVDGSNYGFVWRMSENLYLGGAAGKEDGIDLVAPTVVNSRDLWMLGLAYRSSGDFIWRVEYDIIEYANFKNAAGVDQYAVDLYGTNTQMLHLEMLRQKTIAAYTWYASKGVTGYTANTLSGYNFDVGYAPFEGFSIALRYEFSEREVAGVRTGRETATSYVVGYQF